MGLTKDALWMVRKGGGWVDVDVDMDMDSIHAGPGGGGACRPEITLDDEN